MKVRPLFYLLLAAALWIAAASVILDAPERCTCARGGHYDMDDPADCAVHGVLEF